MKKTPAHLLNLAALSAAPVALWAAGPVPQTAEVAQAIAAPPAAVWAVIGNFQDMRWHPAVIRSEGSGGNDPGATRTLTLPGGDRILEVLETYDPVSRGYAYHIEQADSKVLPVTHYRSSLSVTADATGGSLVTWTGTFERGDPSSDPAPDLNDEAAVTAVTGVYQGGLANLRSRLEQPKK